MQAKSTLLKVFMAMTLAIMLMAWGASLSQAQTYGGSSDQKPQGTMNDNNKMGSSSQGSSDMDHDKTMGSQSESNMSDNSYIIYIPATGSDNTCHDVLKDFSSSENSQYPMGSSYSEGGASSKKMGMTEQGSMSGKSGTHMSQMTNRWEWGCSSDDKALYVFTHASSEKEALEQVPSNLRSAAKVIKMTGYSGSPSMHNMKSMDQGSKSSSPSKGNEHY